MTVLEQDFVINPQWSPELRDLLDKLFKRDPRQRIGGSRNMGFQEI